MAYFTIEVKKEYDPSLPPALVASWADEAEDVEDALAQMLLFVQDAP